MSVTFTDILFAIVVIFLVISGIVFFMKTQRTKEVRELENRKDEMMTVSIADQLFTLKNMELSGQTKRKYESLVATWQTLTNYQFTEIESTIIIAEQYIDQMKLIKAKNAMNEATDLLESTEIEVNELHDELTKLIDVTESNQVRYESLLERYNTSRKNIMNHSFDYGPAIETLEKNLQYLELNFTRYNELMSEGDYLEAQDMLGKTDSDLSTLEEILEKLPKMYSKITSEYEENLEDIAQGYKRMEESKFKFDDVHVLERVDEIQERLNEAKTHIKNADLAEAQTLMDKSERDINAMYDFLQAEIDAKEAVQGLMHQLTQSLAQIKDDNRYTTIEVDRIAQSYVLHDNQEDRIANITENIQRDQEEFTQLSQEVKEHEAIYTKVLQRLKRIEKRIDEYLTQQQGIIQSLASLSHREKDAKSNLDLFELDLRNMKRRLEKQHLPGLSQSFYDKFYLVTDQIEYMSKELNRVQVDMNEVEALEQDLAENMATLEEMAEEYIDNATLTEYMIQHSNRFRYDIPEMEQAIREAEFLFYEQFRYGEALNVIEKALYRVDREGPTQVRRMYQQEKQHRIY